MDSEVLYFYSTKKSCLLVFSLRPGWMERQAHICQLMLAFHSMGFDAELSNAGRHALLVRNYRPGRD